MVFNTGWLRKAIYKFCLLLFALALLSVLVFLWLREKRQKVQDQPGPIILKKPQKITIPVQKVSAIETATSVEIGGLELSIKDLEWKNKFVYVHYSFRLLNAFIPRDSKIPLFTSAWALQEYAVLKFHYWDKNDRKIRGEWFERIVLGEDFVFGKIEHWNDYINTIPPTSAKYIAIQFEESNLITKKIELPQEK